MKVTVYGMRDDEIELFKAESERTGIEVADPHCLLDEHTAEYAAGSVAVIIVASCFVTETVASRLAALGVKYVLTRTAGYDHIDISAAARNGLRCANVPVYSRGAVAEHALMLTLALLRSFKTEVFKTAKHDFRYPAQRAKELGELTVGIFGTGFIGSQTAHLLSGFGCRILAYSRHPRPELENILSYVSRDGLFTSCDVIIFHCALNDGTRHIVNRDTIAKMRDGVYLVNAARGEIMDFEAVLDGLRSGKIGGLATDVYTGEAAFIRRDCSGETLEGPIAELIGMDNVIFTPHIAFFTDTAAKNLVSISFENLLDFERDGECKNELHA